MKMTATSKSAPVRRRLGEGGFFNLRVSTATVFCLAGVAAVLFTVIAINPAVGKVDSVGVNGSATTSTAAPATCSWLQGRDLPSVGTRLAGVFFPSNFHHARNPIGGFTALPEPTVSPTPGGKFYAMGGSSSDTPGSDFMHPFQYDPASNTWTTKSATYPDNQVNNMACGVLDVNGADYIYCVGGSAAGATTATDRVFRYEPVTDTITTIAAPWPGAMGTILPGGFAVFNNKLYILGGFNINVGMVDTIWEFTPCPAGWVQKSAHLPTPLGFIPTATLGSLGIATAGGSTWDGTALHDSTLSFAYDPVADTIHNIAAIPRATSQTRGLNFCGSMYVMGGGIDAPNPSNEVDVYDPSTNSWSTGLPFAQARRNFPTATDGSNRIWLAGGYDTSGSPIHSMEIFNCPESPCAPPTPTPTPKRVVNPTSLGGMPMTPGCRIVIDEGFDDITNLPGWALINHSDPSGASGWFQGNDSVFTAFDGLPDAYIAANYYNGGGVATISNWMLTPEVTLQDGSTLTFYTRTVQASGALAALGMPSGACGTGNAFPDRLQVRMSTNGASTNVGTTATDVGDFTNLLLDINPTYAIGGYPEAWTQFTITISGVPSGTSGRLAFRYFVENGGPEGTRSNYIGIDRAVYCAVPSPRVRPTPRPRPSPTARPTPPPHLTPPPPPATTTPTAAPRPTPPPRITPVPPPPSPRPTPAPRP